MRGEVDTVSWHGIDQSLPTHRKTFRLASNLHIEPLLAMGHMVSLWLWAHDNVPLSGLLPEEIPLIEHAAGWTKKAGKFVEAALDARFFDLRDNRYYLHNWADRAGAAIAAREAAKERMRKYRAAKQRESLLDDGDGDDLVTPNVRVTEREQNRNVTPNVRGTEPEQNRNVRGREEKRREEKKKTLKEGNASHPLLGFARSIPGWKVRDDDSKCLTVFAEMHGEGTLRGVLTKLRTHQVAKSQYRDARVALGKWLKTEYSERHTDAKRNDNFGLDAYQVPVLPEDMLRRIKETEQTEEMMS